ncbi:bile acid:sodium symporter family protein [Mucilaginibacter sabulilitoris]|uniref:Bile acid:sodium symporter family protein n=1 Tax=Mucilaginibacter sabulilitoris TaxID=1173583 RepID=A0ABZ0TL44_9SPHI|nr:bile acid:sodium symporter family protein [Mucilaginibacter sabulilitoris]WPU91885.1 bile acid:sodium symporter family protein [Mucilaginibacter sabulilitoris]
MRAARKICLILSLIMVLPLIYGLLTSNITMWQAAAVSFCVLGSVGIGGVQALKNYQYTAWIITAVVSALIYPAAFLKWGTFDLRNKWLILGVVQMVMFGMGIQMSLKDFNGLGSTGKGVLIGLTCHFTIMPLTGLLLTKLFHFDPEIAAGVILIGSCSSGLASNVMVYLARANLVLSVTVTAMATMAAPFLTPLLMKLLAGTLIQIKFITMMMEIINIVLVPIGAALLHDYLKRASRKQQNIIYGIAIGCAIYLLMLPLGLYHNMESRFSEAGMQSAGVFGFLVGAFVVGTGYHQLYRMKPKIDSYIPYLSMFGIIYFTAVTTAAGRENLLHVGLLLFLASVFHNSAGYFFGYWLSRVFGLDKNSSRTVAFEVGLQNGGMASGLAGTMGKLATVGLAAAVFSPWMNISGSVLANYWRKRPVYDDLPKMKVLKSKEYLQ